MKNSNYSTQSRWIRGVLTVVVLVPVGMFLWRGCQPTVPRQQVLADGEVRNPASAGAKYPSLAADGAGGWVMSWTLAVDEGIDAVMVSRMDSSGRWSEPQGVVVAPDLFVNWADFPTVAVSAPGGLGDQAGGPGVRAGDEGDEQYGAAVSWLKRHPSGGTYAYDVQISMQDSDRGAWSPPVTPHRDGTPTEHGFVSMQPLPGASGGVLAMWLDGRMMAGHSAEEDGEHASSGAMMLRSAEIDRSGRLAGEQVIDAMVCECCQTDMTRLLDGRYMAVYRGRTPEEVRDTRAAFYDPSSGRWSDPVLVHNDGWTIGGCPVNGPAAASTDRGHAGVLWYTEADTVPSVRFALLRNGSGEPSFTAPIALETPAARMAGRVDLAAHGDRYFALWTEYYRHPGIEAATGLATVKLASIDVSSGTPRVEAALDLGLTGSARANGYPRMALSGDDLMIAWTQTDPQYRIRTLRLPAQRISEAPPS